jgi:hypothetical protein
MPGGAAAALFLAQARARQRGFVRLKGAASEGGRSHPLTAAGNPLLVRAKTSAAPLPKRDEQ